MTHTSHVGLNRWNLKGFRSPRTVPVLSGLTYLQIKCYVEAVARLPGLCVATTAVCSGCRLLNISSHDELVFSYYWYPLMAYHLCFYSCFSRKPDSLWAEEQQVAMSWVSCPQLRLQGLRALLLRRGFKNHSPCSDVSHRQDVSAAAHTALKCTPRDPISPWQTQLPFRWQTETDSLDCCRNVVFIWVARGQGLAGNGLPR